MDIQSGIINSDEQSNTDFRIFMAEERLKRKIWLPQLTAARMQCSMFEKKVFFGKVSPLLALEHLAANMTIEELK